MAPRSPHIPTSNERSALQKLISRSLPLTQLFPAGEVTITNMIRKGWIERDGPNFTITTAGLNALKAKIPTER